jgi:adenylate cyclase
MSSGAIVFTDIVGFTQVTDVQGDDVALALLERQDRLVREVLPPTARVVKELGDGLLLWFAAAMDAVVTCVALQGRFDGVAVQGVPLWVRIGGHWGTPRRRADDIVGRDVNLASRIADLAGPGETLCSGALATEAGNVPGVRFEDLGPVFVRGIAEAVPIVRAVSC